MTRLLPWLALACLACSQASVPAPDGQGLVILPYEGPLARGVEARDPRLSFHDFGRVADGETVTRVFQMQNRDPRPVAILQVKPGCGCTGAEVRVVHADGTIERGESIRSKAERLLVVPPGELAELEIQVDTRDLVTKNGHKLITLLVTTDSPNGYYLNFEFHIIAEQPFVLVPATLALGTIPENGGGKGQLEIVQAGGLRHELAELLPPPAGVHAELQKELRNLTPVWVLKAALDAPLPRGAYSSTLRIATVEASGEPGKELSVPLTATVVGDLLCEPKRIVFPAPRDVPARGATTLSSLLAGQRLRVTGVELPPAARGLLSARFEPEEPDDEGTSLRWRLTLETIPPLPAEELLSGNLLVRLDDAQNPSIDVEYVVHLR